MKAIILHIILVNLALGFSILQPCFSQKWGGDGHAVTRTSWIVNVNGGLTSYFGDLSPKNPEIWAKLDKESGPALSIVLTRNIFRNVIGLSGQVVGGKLRGQDGNISFTTDLVEYNIHARIDFVSLFMLGKSHAFGVVGYAGAGKFLFSAKKVVTDEGSVKTFKYDTSVPEFVYFFGIGTYYKLNSNFGITADFSIRQSRNDRLDNYVKNNNYDFYSYSSVGVSYYITTIKSKPLKNKARLANSNFRFRSSSRVGKL